jgi:hypothetical protein
MHRTSDGLTQYLSVVIVGSAVALADVCLGLSALPPQEKASSRVDRFFAYCRQQEARFERGVFFEYSVKVGEVFVPYQMYASQRGILSKANCIDLDTKQDNWIVTVRNDAAEFQVSKRGSSSEWTLNTIRNLDSDPFPLHFEDLRKAKSPWCLETVSVDELVRRSYVQVVNSSHDVGSGLTNIELKCERPKGLKENIADKLPFLHDQTVANVFFEDDGEGGYRIVRVVYKFVIEGVPTEVTDEIKYLDKLKYLYTKTSKSGATSEGEFCATYGSEFQLTNELELSHYGINLPSGGQPPNPTKWYWFLFGAVLLAGIAYYIKQRNRN